jgi:hypothetical protein
MQVFYEAWSPHNSEAIIYSLFPKTSMKKEAPLNIQGPQKISNKKRGTPKNIRGSKYI